MARRDPNQGAQDWANGIANSGQKVQRGVQAVTVNPATQAMAAKPKMIQNFTAAMQQGGKFDRSMAKVTLPYWQDKMINLGIPRMQQGASAAIPRMTQFLTALYAAQEPIINAIKQMPNVTKADAKARMNSWFDQSSALKGKL